MDSEKLYRVQEEDLSKLEELLCRSFAADPLYVELIPDEEVRKRLMPELFQCDLTEFYETCEIFADSKDLNGILVVSDETEPYHLLHRYFTEVQATLRTEGYLIREDHSLKTFFNFVLGRDYLNSSWTDQLHQDRRLHIIYLAVDPEMQHHGIAATLVEEAVAYAERNDLMISLETHNPRNVAFYQQFGFKVYGVVEKHFSLKQYCLVREIQAADGYALDTTVKTFYVEYGGTSTITWKNTPITGQIQIVKKSADYNPTNGLPAETLLEGAVFEITDKAGNVVDTIRSNSRGLAVSKQLPLSRYFVREIKAPEHYGINDKELTAYLEYEGQILRFEVEDKSLSTGVAITKTGPKEIVAGQPVRYAFSGIANTSNVSLSNFYWRDTLPAQVRLDTVVTGTYNRPGTYKIVYRVNGGGHRTLADNLSTQKNYTLAASATALKLASNERVTEIMFVFGQAPAGFAQVEKPYLHCKAVTGLSAGSFVNVADVGGTYGGTWVQGISRWVTTVYGKPVIPTLPKTGY